MKIVVRVEWREADSNEAAIFRHADFDVGIFEDDVIFAVSPPVAFRQTRILRLEDVFPQVGNKIVPGEFIALFEFRVKVNRRERMPVSRYRSSHNIDWLPSY